MKKKITKALSLFLTVVLVSGMFSGFSVVSQAVESNVLFSDDFESDSSMTSNGWSGNSAGTKADGVYTMTAGKSIYTSKAENASDWSDYVVSVKVKFDSEEMPSATDTTTYYAALVARSTNVHKSGYEFNMKISKGSTYFQLSKRHESGTVDVNGTQLKKTDAFTVNTEYTLKMLVSGAMIICYCNDEEIFRVTDGYADGYTYAQGYAGFRCSNMATAWDDFIVRNLTEAEKKEILSMQTGYEYIYVDDFNDSATMKTNGWNSDNAGVKADGVYTQTAGQSIYTSKVDSASTWSDYVVSVKVKFDAEEMPSVTDTKTYYAALVARSTNAHKSGYEFNMKISKGSTYFQLSKRHESGTVDVNGTQLKKTDEFAVNTEYTLKMLVSGAVIICYCNDEEIFRVTDAYADEYVYAQGYAGFRCSNMATVWDDFTVRKLTDKEKREILAITEGYEYLFVDDFNDSDTMVQSGWNSDSAGTKTDGVYTLKASQSLYTSTVENASMWTNYVVSAKVKFDAEKMPDSTDTAIYSGALVARSTNTLKTGYEFNMRIFKGSTYFQLLKRHEDGTVDVNGSQLKKTDEFTVNTEYALEMVVSGATIICYCDDEEIFCVTDAYADGYIYAQGYTGIRSAGIATVWEDYIVRELTTAEKAYIDSLISSDDKNENEEPQEEGIYFKDDFENSDSMTSTGWNSNSSGTKEDGVYTLTAGKSLYSSQAKDASTWTDYVVSSKVMLVDEEMPSVTDTTMYYAALVGRSTNLQKSGYEFNMRIFKGSTYFQLLKRHENGTVDVNGSQLKKTGDFTVNTEYTLKMLVSGATIICYCDDEEIFRVTDAYADNYIYAQGYTGIRSAGITTVWEDYIVRELTTAEKEYIDSLTSSDDKDENEEPKDVEIYFKDDFETSDSMTSTGWNSNGSGTKEDGVYTLTAGKSLYSSKAKVASTWTDYVVSSKVTLVAEEMPSATDTTTYYAALVARSTNLHKSGYEFNMKISKGSTYFQLAKRHADGTVNVNDEVLKKTARLNVNQEYTLTMYVSENTILCYCDDKLIFFVTDENVDGYIYEEGYAGLRASKMTTVWDDFVVRAITDGEANRIAAMKAGYEETIDKNSGEVWFYDDFDAESVLTDRGWGSDKISIYNGSLLFDKASAVYVTGVDGAEEWKDYSVSADVVVDKINGSIDDATVGAAWVCARSNGDADFGTTTGYEFGIMTLATGTSYLRLYDRTTKQNLMVDKAHPITEGVHNLQITCEGTQIRCYFDGELVMVTNDTTNTSGYAGVRSSGYITTFDEFKVTSVGVSGSGTTGAVTESPKTGDFMDMNMRVWMVLMLLATCTIVAYSYKES